MADDKEGNAIESLTKFLENDVVRMVYGEVIHPPARALGRLAELAICIAGAPLELAARLAKRVVDRVPPERMIPAPAPIAGPVLEAARWRDASDPLSEMFEELLTRACDRETVHAVNPAYAELIRLLSPDEARLLYWISQRPVLLNEGRWFKTTDHMRLKLPEHGTEIVCYEFPYWRLSNGDSFSAAAYLGHLHHLGLVGNAQVESSTFGRRQVSTQRLLLTPYGAMFAETCIPTGGFQHFAEDLADPAWDTSIGVSDDDRANG